MATSSATSSATSMRSPFPTTTGRAAVRNGPSRCSTALTGATTRSGPSPPGRPRSPPPPSCQSSRSRRPMVDTSGLTRSKGSVSHAGRTSPPPGPPPGVNPTRSWASCSADAPVGVTTSTGRRAPNRTSPARTKAWAGVATARVALDAPMTRVMAGSFAGGQEASGGSPAQGTGAVTGGRQTTPTDRDRRSPGAGGGRRPLGRLGSRSDPGRRLLCSRATGGWPTRRPYPEPVPRFGGPPHVLLAVLSVATVYWRAHH